jgi:hypothetical protein
LLRIDNGAPLGEWGKFWGRKKPVNEEITQGTRAVSCRRFQVVIDIWQKLRIVNVESFWAIYVEIAFEEKDRM